MNSIVIESIRACNLRCPYCYYINEDTKEYGKIISNQTLTQLFIKVKEYLVESGVNNFAFIWHGGEPLMLGMKRFKNMLQLQAEILQDFEIVNLLQTNGVLINQQWIDFFKAWNIQVGISVDGDKEYHDQMRSTIAGRGTFEKIKENLRLLTENEMDFGILCVVNGKFNPRRILDTFIELGIACCDFLIPMTNNVLQNRRGAGYVNMEEVGKFLSSCFDLWVTDYSTKIDIRMFHYLMNNAFGIPNGYINAGNGKISDTVICETDGQICLDTEFSLIDRYELGTEYALKDGHIDNPDFHFCNFLQTLESEFSVRSDFDRIEECQSCTMRSICRGGHPGSRYGEDHSFNHKSAYCVAMFELCSRITNFIQEQELTEALTDPQLKELIYS